MKELNEQRYTLDDEEIIYKKLYLNDKEEVKEAIECIAECFTGIHVNGIIKSEPMNIAVNLDKETVYEFVYDLFVQHKGIDQGYCFIAKDKITNKVIGAAFCKLYDPNSSTDTIFTGKFEKYNEIFRFINVLDERFNEAYKAKYRTEIQPDTLLNWSALGIRGKALNGSIFEELQTRIENAARENGLLGIFAEATNPRSQNPLLERYGYINILDTDGNPVLLKYADDAVFCSIPKEISEDCKLLYKELK